LNIDIESLENNLRIKEIDIDRFDLYQNRFKKYDLEVPVLAIQTLKSCKVIELPRPSPRLKNIQLKNWLQRNINIALNKKS